MYRNDDLVYHSALKARWAAEMLRNIKIARERIEEIETPALIIHGTEDHLVPHSASEFIFKNIKSEDKTFEVAKIKKKTLLL